MSLSKSRVIVALVLLVLSAQAYAQIGRKQALIDPNVATEKELAALPHVSAAMVKQIMERRPFSNVADLNGLLSESLTKEQVAEVYGKAFIHINLNAAPRAEMMLIPGMGNRMLREFEEYRPYKTLAQFRKEIGKYVDEREVARLEQYVFIPIKLNTASDEEILGIPGLGNRMLREFKEYRPYKTIEQFRKEIGKYVNAKEVARLERYVVVE